MGGKFRRHLFYCWDVSFYGGYLGVMAKLGPFVGGIIVPGRGGFGQVYSPFVGVVNTCMQLAGLLGPGCWLGCWCWCCTGRRCGSHGCGRNCRLSRSWGGSTWNIGWHILMSVKIPVFQLPPPTPKSPPTGSPFPSCYPYRWGAYTFMISTHFWPKFSPYTPKPPKTSNYIPSTTAPSW